MADSIISASDLTKSFGPSAGIFDMDLDLESGRIIGFIGPSGSGKTTTVRLMTGILAPDKGEIRVLGIPPTDFTSQIRERLGYMPQDSMLYPDLTLRENINFAASIYGVPLRRSKRIGRLLDFVDLGDAADRLPAEASGGERRRAMLASTLVHDPELIFLDEPTAGIDPILRRKFWDKFDELADQGRTLIVTTQYVGEAVYCHFVAVLARGRLIAFDTPDGLRRQSFHGEMIDVCFERPPTPEDIATLEGTITNQPLQWVNAREARLVVEDAGEATPEIGRWAEERGLAVEKAETYMPSFDDVFVHLLQGHEDVSEDEVEAVG